MLFNRDEIIIKSDKKPNVNKPINIISNENTTFFLN